MQIGNPATAECEVARTNLLASALKTLGANKDEALPLKLFEISDVILLDEGSETGARNERHLVAVYSNKEAGFEVIHGVLNRVMEVLDVPHVSDEEGVKKRGGLGYEWKESNALPSYF